MTPPDTETTADEDAREQGHEDAREQGHEDAREQGHEDAREQGHEQHGAETRHGAVVGHDSTMDVLHVPADGLVALVTALGDDGYKVCLDVTAVDYLTHPGRELPAGIDPERFELVVTLISHERGERIRIRVQVSEADPVVPSLVDLHPGVEAMEREVWDMFGITFADHPDPTRILMPEDWEGHPLRKDYAMGAIPVQFKDAGARP